MRVGRVVALFLAVGAVLFVSGCACRTVCEQEERYADLMVCIKVSQPLSYLYDGCGILEVWGPEGTYMTKEIPMYMGTQVVIFREVPVGRYVLTLTYAGMVVTKCAVLCGSGEAQWRAQCMQGLKEMLKGKRKGGGWRPLVEEEFCSSPSPAVGFQENCQGVVCFNIPEDVLRVDP